MTQRTTTVKEEWVSPAQQRAEIEARERVMAGAPVTWDHPGDHGNDEVDCSNQNALWLYDGYNLTGNQLCVYETMSGYVGLSLYYRPGVCTPWNCYLPSWVGAVRSYWAGSQRGYLWKEVGQEWPYEEFATWQQVNNAGPIAQTASHITLVGQ